MAEGGAEAEWRCVVGIADVLRETKTFAEFKAFEGERVVAGFASIFGNVDDGGDLITPGAYVKTLAERGERLRWLWQHDMTQPPVARVVEAREATRDELPGEVLARFPEATGGLLIKREYLDTQRGNEVLAGIRAGAIAEMSIGYDALQADYPERLEVSGRRVRRVLKEIRLWEGSDVNWGMNAATANLKSFDRKALAEWLESRIHLTFTQIADDLFGDGIVTRQERIALSGLIGDALDVFHQGMQDDVLAGVRGRERWESAPAEEELGEDERSAGEDEPSAGSSQGEEGQKRMEMAMRQRRLAVLARALNVV